MALLSSFLVALLFAFLVALLSASLVALLSAFLVALLSYFLALLVWNDICLLGIGKTWFHMQADIPPRAFCVYKRLRSLRDIYSFDVCAAER